MRNMTIGIAGAGLLGRLLAWQLSRHGHEVQVFDPAPHALPTHDGQGAAGFTAAGMLSPLAELDTAEPDVAVRGWQSIAHWRAIAAELGEHIAPRKPPRKPPRTPPHFAQHGSLMVAHGPDLGAARRVLSRLDRPQALLAAGFAAHQTPIHAHAQPQALSPEQLRALEPELHGSGGPLHAWLLPGEAHIDTVAMMQALHDGAPGARWHWGTRVQQVTPGCLWLAPLADPSAAPAAAHAFDLVCDVRGVGARPALPDHRPHIHTEPGLMRLNGLYRHGWLLAPSLADEALRALALPGLPGLPGLPDTSIAPSA